MICPSLVHGLDPSQQRPGTAAHFTEPGIYVLGVTATDAALQTRT